MINADDIITQLSALLLASGIFIALICVIYFVCKNEHDVIQENQIVFRV